MATAAEILSDACVTGIGKVVDPIQLLQIVAQIEADKLLAASPGTSISAADIITRSCASGIGKIKDESMLLAIIAQLLNEQ